MTNRYTCRCGEPAVTELVPLLADVPAEQAGNIADDGMSGTSVVYVFPYWCPRCFAAKFGPLVRTEVALRQAVGMARARDMIQRERWGG